jgi:hypothetical protein
LIIAPTLIDTRSPIETFSGAKILTPESAVRLPQRLRKAL